MKAVFKTRLYCVTCWWAIQAVFGVSKGVTFSYMYVASALLWILWTSRNNDCCDAPCLESVNWNSNIYITRSKFAPSRCVFTVYCALMLSRSWKGSTDIWSNTKNHGWGENCDRWIDVGQHQDGRHDRRGEDRQLERRRGHVAERPSSRVPQRRADGRGTSDGHCDPEAGHVWDHDHIRLPLRGPAWSRRDPDPLHR